MTEIGGLDWSLARPDPVALAHAGFTFVMRYFSNTPAKNLTAGELVALNAAGLQVGVVWETTADRALSGSAGGTADGAAAEQQANATGYPVGAAIFFAVDWDAQPSDLAAIAAYAHGFNSKTRRPVGVYGSGAVLAALVTPGQQPVQFGWQAGGATAWAGNGTLSPKANIFQRGHPTNWPAVAGTDENVLCLPVPLAGPALPPPPPPPPPPAPVVTAQSLAADPGVLVAYQQLLAAVAAAANKLHP